jgi:hypothetical protein
MPCTRAWFDRAVLCCVVLCTGVVKGPLMLELGVPADVSSSVWLLNVIRASISPGLVFLAARILYSGRRLIDEQQCFDACQCEDAC